jgi:hypothetical protein
MQISERAVQSERAVPTTANDRTISEAHHITPARRRDAGDFAGRRREPAWGDFV